MLSNKHSFLLFIIFFNILATIFSNYLGSNISGLFVGSILGMGLLYIDKDHFVFVDKVFTILLYANLIMLINNLFFADYFIIPPLFSSPDETYNKTIIRAINIFGNEFLMRRTTGLSDNIHVSSLLNLILCYILWVKNQKKMFYLASAVLFFSMNMQFILIYFIWLGIRERDVKLNFKALILLVSYLFLLFFLVDLFILDSAYYNQIISSDLKILLSDLKTYYNAQTVKSFFFGIKPGEIDDPYDMSLGYYIPLTDIGIIGIPIQFGLGGLISILLLSFFWFIYAKKKERKFILPLFFSAIHYFSLVSFVGVLFITWLVRYPPKSKHHSISTETD
jgi:hypothetical protein